MAGDGLIRPVNTPGTAPLAYGTQPGTSTGVVLANKVIVSGSGGGVFIYSGTPALGNPPIAWMGSGLVDPFGNVLSSTTGVASSGTFQAGNQVITPSGTVGYSATPAANNMLFSDAPATFTDSSGNAVLAGVTTYGLTGITYYALNQLPGLDHTNTFGAVTTVYTATSQAGPWTAGAQVNLAGGNHMSLLADLLAFYGVSGAPTLALHSGSSLLSAAAGMTANAQGAVTLSNQGGWTGQIPAVSEDVTTLTNNNLGSANRVTAIYTIPANDLAIGTEYCIEFPFVAAFSGVAADTLELGLSIDGSTSYTANNTINGSIVGAGVSINGVMRVYLKCITTGAGGTVNAWTDGSIGLASATTLFSNSGGLAGNLAAAASLDTTASHTIRVNSTWAVSNASQALTVRGSKCTRSGP